ncbi:MAG TPA: zinc-ribbon domain-containing protein [Acidimicrobiales bacterium]
MTRHAFYDPGLAPLAELARTLEATMRVDLPVRPRDDIISEYFGHRGLTAAAAPPAPPAAPAPGDPAAPSDADEDRTVDAAIAKLEADLAELETAQAKDSADSPDKPADAKVAALIPVVKSAIDQLKAAQAQDEAADAAPPAPPAPAKPAPPVPPAAAGADAQAFADGEGYEPEPYHADPDESVKCPVCSKMNDDDAVFCDQCGTKLAGNPDVTEGATPEEASGEPQPPIAEPAPKPDAVPVQAASTTPGNDEGIPGDADDSPPGQSDVPDTEVCQNPDCGHMASVHTDMPESINAGACTTEGCTCEGMVPAGTPTGGADDSTGGPDNAGGDAAPAPGSDDHAAAGGAALAAPPGGAPAPASPPAAPGGSTAPPTPPTAAAPPPGSDPLPEPDPSPTADLTGPAFAMVCAIEGVPTDDRRMIAPQALTWREPPLPLMWMDTSAHDPDGMSPNDPAFLAGNIESFTRDGNVVQAFGHFLTTDEALHAADQLQQMGRFGVSVDLGAVEQDDILDDLLNGEISSMADAPETDGPPVEVTVTAGKILAVTGCPMAASPGAFIVLGETLPEAAPEPLAASASSGAMAFRIVAEEACEPCEAAGLVLVASAAGPIAPPMAWFDDPQFSIDHEHMRELYDPRTGKASGRYACPTTVLASGEAFGHLAAWGVCHTSPQYRGKCMLAPRSRSGYAHWYRGQVLTAEGELVDTGALTAGLGHAPDVMSMSHAMAHYDNARFNVANVVVGEDEFGIWFHGAVNPSASEEQVYTLRASSLSGDWRPLGRGLELVAALAVNSPGFPIAKAHRLNGKITSLVAAGSLLFEAPEIVKPRTVEERLSDMERGYAPLAPIAMQAERERFERAWGRRAG